MAAQKNPGAKGEGIYGFDRQAWRAFMAPVLGALFAILVGILAIRPYLDYQRQSFENIKAANTASQFRQLINAVQLYVQGCLPTIEGVSSSASSAASPTCSAFAGGGQDYNIPLSSVITTLQTAGYLPQGTNVTNPYGQAWYISVSQQNGIVQALLYSAKGQAIPTRLAPEIAAETGQEGGFVPQKGEYGSTVGSNTAEGAYGHWNVPIPPDASPAPVAGDLVALLDVGQNGIDDDYSGDYLYRRQMPGDKNGNLNTMQTDLNMRGNNIFDADEVETGSTWDTGTIMSTNSSESQVEANYGTPGPVSNGVQMLSSSAQESASPSGAMFYAQSQLEYPSSNSGTGSSAELGTDSMGDAALSLIGPQTADIDLWGTNSSKLIMTSSGPVSTNMQGSTSATFNMQGSTSAAFNMKGSTSAAMSVNGGAQGANVGVTSSGTSTLSVTGDNGSALALFGKGALIFSSMSQNAGTSCASAQLGTIAPNVKQNGMPLFCYQPSWSSNPIWGQMGSSFSHIVQVTYQPGILYPNTSSGPEFISSNCLWTQSNQIPWGDSSIDYSLFLYVYDANGNVVATAHNGVGTTNATTGASPSASIVVPSGDSFEYTTDVPSGNSGEGSAVPSNQTCNFTVVQ